MSSNEAYQISKVDKKNGKLSPKSSKKPDGFHMIVYFAFPVHDFKAARFA